jgi:hypothetical protein
MGPTTVCPDAPMRTPGPQVRVSVCVCGEQEKAGRIIGLSAGVLGLVMDAMPCRMQDPVHKLVASAAGGALGGAW